MKFTCTQENLSRGLGMVNRVASKNVALPILNNVLLEADNGVVRLQTTNLELGMTATVRAKIEQPGKYTVQSRLLSEFINLLGNEKVEFEVTDQGLQITSGHSQTTIKGLPAEEFPVMPTPEEGQTVTVPASLFHHALQGVVFAVANNEARPEISGVFFQCHKEELIIAATDSYRLAERRVHLLEGASGEKNTIVPSRTIQELLRVLPTDETAITLHIGDNQLHITMPEAELISRLIDGHYPEYQQIIPQQWQVQTTTDRQEFIDHVRSASLFCQPGINDIVLTVKPEEKSIVFEAGNSQLGDHQSSLPTSIQGGGMTITFNYRYLLDGLGSLSGDTITLELTDSNGPGVLRGSAEQELYLLMPIRK